MSNNRLFHGRITRLVRHIARGSTTTLDESIQLIPQNNLFITLILAGRPQRPSAAAGMAPGSGQGAYPTLGCRNAELAASSRVRIRHDILIHIHCAPATDRAFEQVQISEARSFYGACEALIMEDMTTNQRLNGCAIR